MILKFSDQDQWSFTSLLLIFLSGFHPGFIAARKDIGMFDCQKCWSLPASQPRTKSTKNQPTYLLWLVKGKGNRVLHPLKTFRFHLAAGKELLSPYSSVFASVIPRFLLNRAKISKCSNRMIVVFTSDQTLVIPWLYFTVWSQFVPSTILYSTHSGSGGANIPNISRLRVTSLYSINEINENAY